MTLLSKLQQSAWIFFLILIGCQEETPPPIDYQGPSKAEWLVPVDKVIDSGVGKDGIPSVDDPQFSDPSEVNPLFYEDMVLGIEYEGEFRAYPIDMLNWHEIVNDNVNGLPVAITYCPLTGTGIGWVRKLGSAHITFGVSGLLYNTNLMPYDRRTQSTWSQQKLECVNGHLVGEKPETITLIATKFSTWKASFPDSRIMNANTGFDRRYSEYPYGFYRTDHDLLFFPVDPLDKRLAAKEEVLGVLMEDGTKAYRFSQSADSTEVIQDQIGEIDVVVVRSNDQQYLVVFLNPDRIEFAPVQDGLPAIMTDEAGNAYDLVGRAISGPDQGKRLEIPVAMMGYWFSWGAFYPEMEIYGE